MRKKYLIILLLVIAVAGVLWLVMGSKSGSTDKMTGKPQSNDAFSSIKDALSKSVSLTCDFTDENGNHMVTNIKNGAVRADITSDDPQQSGSTIIRDKKMYFWNAKTAMMMEMPDIATTPGATEENGNANQDILKEMEKYKSSCKPAVVADSLFTPPTDREFTDYSKMMPPSTQNGSEANSEEYKKMMQQYKQQ